ECPVPPGAPAARHGRPRPRRADGASPSAPPSLPLVAPPRIAHRRPCDHVRSPIDGFLSFAQEVPPPPPPATTFHRRLHVIFTRRYAHLFSIRTNGLSLKPRDRLPPSRLIHRGRLARENFCNLARWRENFFRALFRALFRAPF